MIILGIDPGIGRIGWGFVQQLTGKQKLIDYGCFETDSKLSQEERLALIHQFFIDLITKNKPDAIAIEQLFFATNAKTAFSVGQARGVIVLACSSFGIPLTSYTPLQVKLAISGYGKADKNQVQQMVKSLLRLSNIPKPDDAADALAIALTHAFSYKLRTQLL
jgi:crossover junction endodeoxyribonuclease RuvC